MKIIAKLDNGEEIELKEIEGLDKECEVIFVKFKSFASANPKYLNNLYEKLKETTGKKIIFLNEDVEKLMTF